MSIQTTYSNARGNLAHYFDEVTENQEVVIVSRRGRPKVAIVAADELEGLLETAHLLRSPKNAERLLTSLKRALSREGQPRDVDDVRRELGLDEET